MLVYSIYAKMGSLSCRRIRMSKALNVAMIVIGDEILNGRTTDANGVWL